MARRSLRKERERLIEVLRAEGMTWVQIAEDFQTRYNVNARVAMRWAHGWTQAEVATRWSLKWSEDPKTAWNISVWETWPHSGHAPTLHVLDRLAELYECATSDLVTDRANYRHRDRANAPSVVAFVCGHAAPGGVSERQGDGNDEDVNRRHFTGGAAALAAVGLAEPLHALTGLTSRGRQVIGPEHIEFVHAAITHVDEHDAAFGGGSLRPSVAALRDQVEDWLTGDYTVDRGVIGELQGALSGLYTWSGWLALDDNDNDAARRHISDGLVYARIADDPRLEAEALDRMWFLLRTDRPRESLHCAEAAQRTASGWATPKVSALIHLRIAHAHAHMSEEGAFSRELARSMSDLERGSHSDDPAFYHFMTSMELTGVRARCLQVLGKPDRAVEDFQSIIENPDPLYRRNLGLYTVRLAQAHAANHDITAAAETGLSAMGLVGELESARPRQLLAELRATIEPHRRITPAAGDFAERYDQEVPLA